MFQNCTEYKEGVENWGTKHSASIHAEVVYWRVQTDEGTGAVVIGPKTSYYESMGIFSSIFQAKFHAIEQCVVRNLDRKYNGQDIVIMPMIIAKQSSQYWGRR